MHRRGWVFGLALFSVLAFLGCGGGGNRRHSKPAPTGDLSPQKTFGRTNEAILKGDYRTAYDLKSSNAKATLTYEQFCKDCVDNKARWEVQLKGAVMSVVSIDDDGVNASGIVIFGDGVKYVVDFIREDGIWRENGFYGLNRPGGR